jgi:uncharacterized protein YndB with AHSA1/START domain
MADDIYELSVSRLIDASPADCWKTWTDHLAEWFCPKPWTVELIEMDLRPGGRSALIMRGPGGEEMPQEGVYLEAVPEQRIVFTDAFRSGWLPQGPFMVGFFEFTAEGDKTRYTAGARHWTAEAKAQHEAMGFAEGWGEVAEQFAEVAERLAGRS